MNEFKSLENMMLARYPIIYVQTHEHKRVTDRIFDLALNVNKEVDYECYNWNIVNGLSKYNPESKNLESDGSDDVSAEMALIDIEKKVNDRNSQIFIIEDFHEYINDPEIKVRLRLLSESLKMSAGHKHIILLSPTYILPIDLEKYITVLNMPLPGEDDLRQTLDFLVADIRKSNPDVILTKELKEELVNSALGMTTLEAEQAFALSYIEGKGFSKESKIIINREKKQLIQKSGYLDFFDVPRNFHENVGGLENLKAWINRRGIAFSKDAKEFGIKEPKGLLLTGVPGCGKSLTSKAISSMWQMPLLRLDIGKVFEGEVGSSEHNIRKALDIAEAVAPSILWIDEIEKGLSGIQSSGSSDGGTSSRVFGTILTWMQEKEKPVFVVATSNDIDKLPPELLRKGRFDEIFFVDLPGKEERENIFRIHIKNVIKNKSSIDEKYDVSFLADETKGFNGAEIEEVVKEAMLSAYLLEGPIKSLSLVDLLNAIKEVEKSILIKVMRDKIQYDRKRAKERFKMASTVNPESIEDIFKGQKKTLQIKTAQESRNWILPQED